MKELEDIDIEKFIDDFVVMMLFVGNDFLPRIPTFEIDEGAIDCFLKIYKQRWNVLGYLSENGKIHWQVLSEFLKYLPEFEFEALKKKITRSNKK